MAASGTDVQKKVNSLKPRLKPRRVSSPKRYTPEEFLYIAIRKGSEQHARLAIDHKADWGAKFDDIPLYGHAIMNQSQAIKKLCIEEYLMPKVELTLSKKDLTQPKIIEILTDAVENGDELLASMLVPLVEDLSGNDQLFYLAFQKTPAICASLLLKNAETGAGSELLDLKTTAIKLGLSGHMVSGNYVHNMEGWHKGYATRELKQSLSEFIPTIDQSDEQQPYRQAAEALLDQSTHILKELARQNTESTIVNRSLNDIREEFLSSDQNLKYKIHAQDKAGIYIYRNAFGGHMFDIVIDWDNARLAFCNRGSKIGLETAGITVFENIDISNFDTASLSTTLSSFIQNPNVFNDYMQEAFGINLNKPKNASHVIEMMPQDVGNCAWASLESSMIAYFYLRGLAAGNSSNDAELFSVNMFRKWYIFELDRTFNKFFGYCQNSASVLNTKVSLLTEMLGKYQPYIVTEQLKGYMGALRALEQLRPKSRDRLQQYSSHILYECWFEQLAQKAQIKSWIENSLFTAKDIILASRTYIDIYKQLSKSRNQKLRYFNPALKLLMAGNIQFEHYPSHLKQFVLEERAKGKFKAIKPKPEAEAEAEAAAMLFSQTLKIAPGEASTAQAVAAPPSIQVTSNNDSPEQLEQESSDGACGLTMVQK